MILEEAKAADKERKVLLAARLYEKVLEEKKPPLEAFLNLIVLYWQVTDYGFWTGMGLNVEFVDVAARRFRELLERASTEYPESTEVIFWKRYIDWTQLGISFTYEECDKLFKQDPLVLVPSMYLFSLSKGVQAEHEAMRLLEQCKKEGTGRARYVTSIIETTIRQSKWK